MKKHLRTGVIIGILGGALLGLLDGSLIILDELNRSFFFIYILALLVFSVCMYSLLCSIVMTVFCFAGCFAQNLFKKQLTGNQILAMYSGAFCLAAIFFLVFFKQSGLASGFLKQRIIGSLIVIFPAGLFIAAATGMGISYFNEKYHNKNLLAGVGLLLAAAVVLLADGLWLVLLNMHLLINPPFTVSIAANLVSVVIFLAVLKVFFNSFVRLSHIIKIPVVKIIGLVALNCMLFTAVEWSIAAFDGGSAAPVVKTSLPSPAHRNQANEFMRPNVLWIVMDTVRADHLSCYGYKQATSPAVDKIAAEGLVFEKALSTAPWTLPSHASMFTGMYPRTHQTTWSHEYLSNSFTTIAELLRSHGYMTAGFSNNPWVSKLSNLDQGFDTFFEGFASAGDRKQWKRLLPMRLITSALGITNDAGDQLQGWCSARQTNEQINRWLKKTWDPANPFFIFINYMEAHLPYTAPEQFVRPFLPYNISYVNAEKVNQNFIKHYAGLVKMDKPDFDMLSALYDGEISYLDHYMKDLFDQLRASGILDKTIVIISSDHGENLGENKKMGHVFSVDDRLLHVPLIIRYPQKVPAGKRVSGIVQITQIFPTILDIAGITWDGQKTIQGKSLLQQPPATESPSSLGLAELDINYGGIQEIIRVNQNFFVDKYARGYTTIRDQNFKYILASDGTEEIYKLDDDPCETKNVLNQYPDKSKNLRLKLGEALNLLAIPDLTVIETDKAHKMDQQTLKGLRDLGYVQ